MASDGLRIQYWANLSLAELVRPLTEAVAVRVARIAALDICTSNGG
jgi:hypothetical protein